MRLVNKMSMFDLRVYEISMSSMFHSLSSFRLPVTQTLDLFTDKAAILNLLDLRSIMGCPGGTRSVFTRAFRAKRELHCIFLGKKAIIITSKHGTTIFFSHYNLFLGKLKEKLARKARVNTVASISDRAHAPWAFHNGTMDASKFSCSAFVLNSTI